MRKEIRSEPIEISLAADIPWSYPAKRRFQFDVNDITVSGVQASTLSRPKRRCVWEGQRIVIAVILKSHRTCPFWPGRFIPQEPAVVSMELGCGVLGNIWSQD
jgi:hypothetical protein